MLQKLPLGISSFRLLRESDLLYVDKTKHAYELITGGYRYFLSRPRRFGKSLLVSTLQEILAGNKNLFDGLWITTSDYQWQPHGVIVLDFSKLNVQTIEMLNKSLIRLLSKIAQDYALTETIDFTSPDFALQDIVAALHRRFGKVAILIDEYDNPMVNTLNHQEKAQEIRDILKHFFAQIKSLDSYLNFVLITGVSAFAKAGLFSGINNLQIITLINKFSDICGYTDQEVDHYFTDYIRAWASKKNITYEELRGQIKDWYNGYQFGRNVPTVYNPFSLMNALAEQIFMNFWIKSGTPTFLIEQLKKYHSQHDDIIVDLEGLEVNDDILQSFEIGEIPLPALMFQAGYITLSEYDDTNDLYSLAYPNREAKIACKEYLPQIFSNLNHRSAHITEKINP